MSSIFNALKVPASSASPSQKQNHAPGAAAAYDELLGLVRTADAVRKRKADEAADLDEVWNRKIESLVMFRQGLEKDRSSLVASYNSSKAARTQEAEDEFWAKIADVDGLLKRTSEQIDDAKLKLYFPVSKGYTYRIAAGGTYLAVGDFLLSRLTGKLIVEAVSGRGECWVPGGGTPPGLRLRAAPISLSILLTDLGIRSDSTTIPASLRHIRELEMSVEMEVLVPLAFSLPPRSFEAGASGGAGAQARAPQQPMGPGSEKQPGINALSRFRWSVLPQFKFEVTKLDCRTRSSMPVPTTILKPLINSIAPPYIQSMLVSLMPPELGILLALHGDHQLTAAGDITIASIPLEVLHAPLDSAVESGLHMTLPPQAQPQAQQGQGQVSHQMQQVPMPHMKIASAGVSALLDDAAGNSQASLVSGTPTAASAGNKSAAGAAAAAAQGAHPAQVAAKAARALGLNATQARAFVGCQLASPTSKGVPFLRSAQDIINFSMSYNPHSSHKRTQAAASGPSAAVTGVARGASGGGLDEEMTWDRMCDTLQRCLDEYVHSALAVAMDAAAVNADRAKAKSLAAAAHSRAMGSIFNVRDLVAAAEQLYKKPVALRVKLNDLTIRFHAETAIGLSKAMSLRVIRAKQKAAVSNEASRGKRSTASAATASAAPVGSPVPTSGPGGSASSRPTPVHAGNTGGLGDSQLTAKELQAKEAASGPTSLVLQAQAVHGWAHEAFDQIRLVHGYVTRVTASTSGWLHGGPRGKLAACIRQLQLECAPGICLPLSMQEGFFPPGTMVTAMEGRDEYSAALGWAAAGAAGGAQAAGKQPLQRPEEKGKGRGTWSVMLCWAKKDRDMSPSLPNPSKQGGLMKGDSRSEVLPRASEGEKRVSSHSFSGATPASLDAALSAALDDSTPSSGGGRRPSLPGGPDEAGGGTPGRPGTGTGAYTPQAQPAKLTPADVEVMATVKVHRAWAGLRVDEAALLSMVQRRAEAQQNGWVDTYGGVGKGLPPLHGLELSFRPGLFGSSFNPHGPVSSTQLEQSAVMRRRGMETSPLVMLGGTKHVHGGDAPPMPFVLGLETPVWMRFCAEVQALEASGDIPVLAQQLGAIFERVFSAAQAESAARDEEEGGDRADKEGEEGFTMTGDDADTADDGVSAVDSSMRSESMAVPADAGRGRGSSAASYHAQGALARKSVGIASSESGLQRSASMPGDESTDVLAAADAAVESMLRGDSSSGVRSEGAGLGPGQEGSQLPTVVEGTDAPAGAGSDDTDGGTVSIASSSLAQSAAVLAAAAAAPPAQPAPPAHVRTNRTFSTAGTSVSGGAQSTPSKPPAAASSTPGPSTPAQSREQREARRRYKEERKAMAVAARSVASAEASARLNRYLRSEDLRVAVNLFISVLSVPAPPIAGVNDDGMDGGVSQRGPAALDPVLMDIAGIDSLAVPGTPLSPQAQQHAAVTGRAHRAPMRKVLSLALSSRHAMQPSMIPGPGSGLLAVPTAPAGEGGEAAKPVAATGRSLASAGPTPVVLVSDSASSGAARAGTQGVPVLTAAAVDVTLSISLLTLLDDISVVRAALDTAGALQGGT